MGREFELKYAATPAVLEALATRYPGGRAIAMSTTYFDTPQGALSQRKMTLRLRRENDETVCTLKTPLPDGSRGEWECAAATLTEGLTALVARGVPVDAIPDNLQPICGARFTRLAIDVPTADGMAELALDRGVLTGRGREIPLCEVEIELKSGSEAATLALAQTLFLEYGLTPEPKSKFQRASALAKR